MKSRREEEKRKRKRRERERERERKRRGYLQPRMGHGSCSGRSSSTAQSVWLVVMF